MADSGERRMLFDIRGRRKNVVRVVYAVLALLMGGSLFLTVGPFNLGELVGGGGTSSAAEVLDEQVERIEGRLAKDPTDEALLLTLTRTRIAAGNAQTEEDPTTGARSITPEAAAEFEAAQASWAQYLQQAGNDPSPTAAQLVAGMFFGQAESGGSLAEIQSSLEEAAKAQRVAAEARPNIGSLSTLAIYEYYAGNFKAGDKAGRKAEQLAPSKSAAKNVEKQLAQYRKRGKEWAEQADKVAKIQRKQGKEELQNPLGGLSGGGVTP
jgi:hypothetical protein